MKLRRFFVLTLVAVASGCGPNASGNGDGDNSCPNRCTSFGWEECISPDQYADPVECAEGEVCLADLGCRACAPGSTYCGGPTEDQIWQCNEDGTGGDFVETCPDDKVCGNGRCKTACERAMDLPSNVGCEFWAVDLDNEAVDTMFGVSNDAAVQQYAVAIANNNDYPVTARVFANTARYGEPVAEALAESVTVPPQDIAQINLPQREVDGTMGQQGPYVKGSGSGTFVSSHGFHIVTDAPVVAYQFNPIVQQFSNDASILIPIQALSKHYYVLGWPTANPCGEPPGSMFYQESIPDHTSITIVGVEENTHVKVIPTHPVTPSGGDSGISIPRTEAGTPIEFAVGPYDVVNLESDQPMVPITDCLNYLDQDGDFTGTIVESDGPVAVFSSLERGIGFGGAEPPSGLDLEDGCCTDHMEQQMFPTAALGWEFAVSRSPVRSTDPGFKEPDVYRVLATKNNTAITTNLPGENSSFQLNAGEWRTFATDRGFVVKSEGGAIMVGQYLISQGYIPQGGTGDPTFVVFPAAEQHRKDYVFLVPTTFSSNYFVLAHPEGASVAIDGVALDEFNDCVSAPIGDVKGTPYVQLTCPISEGSHTVSSNKPVGLTVYGYYNVGSYGYPGGSDVKIINPVE